MIDFIKARFIDRDKILNHLIAQKDNHYLEGRYNHSHNQKVFPLRSKRENLFINITEKSAYIENSLHKYFNKNDQNESQNYNDFSYCDILDTLNLLEQELQYPLIDSSTLQLEFGFNVNLGFCPTKFIKSNVLMEKLKSPCYDPKNDAGKKIKKFTYNQYEIKIYNKSLHYIDKLKGGNILRVEVKYKSKKILENLGIKSLHDLRDRNNLFNLFHDFMRKIENVIIVDSFNGDSSMTKEDREQLILYTNPNYWINLRGNKHPNTVLYQKKKFEYLIKNNRLSTRKDILIELLANKFAELIDSDCISKFHYVKAA